MSAIPKSLRERQKLLTRNHLLETAEALFGEKGFAETSIEEILEASGVSRATLYAHFAGKDGLLVGVTERMLDDAQRQYDDFAALAEWSPTSIEKWLRDTAGERISWALRYRLIMSAARAFLSSPEGFDRLDGLVGALRGRAGGWSHLEPHEAAVRSRMLVILIEQQFYDFLSSDDPVRDLEQFVRFTSRAVVLLSS